MGFTTVFKQKNCTKAGDLDWHKIEDHYVHRKIPQNIKGSAENAVKGAAQFDLEVSIDEDAGKAKIVLDVKSAKKTTLSWDMAPDIKEHAKSAGEKINHALKAAEDKLLPENSNFERPLRVLAGEIKVCEEMYDKLEAAIGKQGQDPHALLAKLHEARERVDVALEHGKRLGEKHQAWHEKEELNLKAVLKAILDEFKLKTPDLEPDDQGKYRAGSLKLSKAFSDVQQIYKTHVDALGFALQVKLKRVASRIESQGGGSHEEKGDKEKGAAG